MFQVVYLSRQTVPFAPADLSVLLANSREKNQQRGVTGMLLHHDGTFLQALEGEEHAVRELMQVIGRDARHDSVVVLHQGTVEQRDFPDWSMGFRDLGAEDAASLPGFSPFLESPLSATQFAHDPPRAKALLMAFKASMKPGPQRSAA